MKVTLESLDEVVFAVGVGTALEVDLYAALFLSFLAHFFVAEQVEEVWLERVTAIFVAKLHEDERLIFL